MARGNRLMGSRLEEGCVVAEYVSRTGCPRCEEMGQEEAGSAGKDAGTEEAEEKMKEMQGW